MPHVVRPMVHACCMQPGQAMHVAPTLSACKQGRAQVLPFLDVQLPINPCGEPVASIEVRCWFQTYLPHQWHNATESNPRLCCAPAANGKKRTQTAPITNGTNHERQCRATNRSAFAKPSQLRLLLGGAQRIRQAGGARGREPVRLRDVRLQAGRDEGPALQALPIRALLAECYSSDLRNT